SYAGQPWRTQERVHQITRALYDDTPRGLSGNEDCGQMSAWYVFTALGFYPVTPGSLEYVIGSPHLPRATLRLPGGKTFTVIADGARAAQVSRPARARRAGRVTAGRAQRGGGAAPGGHRRQGQAGGAGLGGGLVGAALLAAGAAGRAGAGAGLARRRRAGVVVA